MIILIVMVGIVCFIMSKDKWHDNYMRIDNTKGEPIAKIIEFDFDNNRGNLINYSKETGFLRWNFRIIEKNKNNIKAEYDDEVIDYSLNKDGNITCNTLTQNGYSILLYEKSDKKDINKKIEELKK